MKIFAIGLLLIPSLLGGQDLSEKKLSIRGIVHIGSSRSVVDDVQLFSQGQMINTKTTNNLGQFEFNDLRSGVYKIAIKQFNFDSTFYVGNSDEKVIWIFLVGMCEVDKKIAEEDILNGRPRLLLIGGISPTYFKGQEKFEANFQARYYDFGCMPPERNCVIEYNETVFAHLDKQFGRRWRKFVRRDVIGFQK